MAGVRVRIDQGALHRMLQSPAGPAGKALLRAGVKVEGAAKRACPVDTGRLRSSVTHELSVDGRGLVCFIGTNTEYAIYVELGTRFSPAQPFLRPALSAA